MKLIKTEDAVGSILCHDITQIIPGVVKDAVFRKGHVVTEEDIPVLLSVGKEHLYVWEQQEGMLHENDAAEVLRQVCQGEHMKASEPKEGKIELTAECDGLLKIDRDKLNKVNAMGQMVLASRHGNFPMKKGDKIVESGKGNLRRRAHIPPSALPENESGDCDYRKRGPFRENQRPVYTGCWKETGRGRHGGYGECPLRR